MFHVRERLDIHQSGRISSGLSCIGAAKEHAANTIIHCLLEKQTKMMEMDHNNIMNISKNTLSKEMAPGDAAGNPCADNSLIKLLSPSFNSPTHDIVANSEASEGLLTSLSDLFEKEDEGGSSLFGSSRWDPQSHLIGEEEELLRSKQKAVKEAYEKWQGGCRSFVQSDDELSNLSASLSDLCASITVLMNKSKGQFQNYLRTSPSKLSTATLQQEIQRLATVRRELLKAQDPKVVHRIRHKADERVRAQRRKNSSDRSISLVDTVFVDLGGGTAGEPAKASKRESPAKNISDITMSPFHDPGLSHSISDVTPRQNLSSAVRRALRGGAALCLPTEMANKCDHVLLHGTQKSEMTGPEHRKKQQSCDFSPRKPKRSSVQEVVSKFEEKTNGGGRETLCQPTRKVSSDYMIPDLMQESKQLRDLEEEASHEEAVVVCPTRPTKGTAVTDACPLQSGFDDRTLLFRRSQSTPVVAAENGVTPKRPSRARSPSKSSEPMLPSPSSPRRIKVDEAIAQHVDAGLDAASSQDSRNPVSLDRMSRVKSAKGFTTDCKLPSLRKLPGEAEEKSARLRSKESKSKSSRHLEKSPRAKSERQLNEKQKSRRSLAVTESPAKHRRSARRLKHVLTMDDISHHGATLKAHRRTKSQASTDDENRASPRRVSDFNMGRVQQLISKLNHTGAAMSSNQGNTAATKDQTPKTPSQGTKLLRVKCVSTPTKKEIVLPGITDCFIRIPSEGTVTSSTSGSSRDVAPVTPRRFPTSFTTSNSCRGFNSKCEQDDREASLKEQWAQQHKEQKDIFLPSLAAADDSRDYSKSPNLSPRKVPPMTLRTSSSCRQFLAKNESVNNESAPVSPRRSTHSPRKLASESQITKSFRHLDGAIEKDPILPPPRQASILWKKGETASCKTLNTTTRS